MTDKMSLRDSSITVISSSTTSEGEYGDRPVDMEGSTAKNIYVSKKTIAQGMFDVALLSSNTNQLVHLINGGALSNFHITAVTFLVISIILQVIVGGCLIAITVMRRPDDPERKAVTRRLNNITTIFIFFITILNVIIPSFTPTMIPSPEGLTSYTPAPYNFHNCTMVMGNGHGMDPHIGQSAEAI